jgi:hypothetical protein
MRSCFISFVKIPMFPVVSRRSVVPRFLASTSALSSISVKFMPRVTRKPQYSRYRTRVSSKRNVR